MEQPQEKIPAHQRPDGVFGEWETVPLSEQNIHQRIARKTFGIVTVANVVTLAGAETTRRGINIFVQGDYMKGVILIAIGRGADLVDGAIAKKTGTLSKMGAGVDAGSDKVLSIYVVVMFNAYGIISDSYTYTLIFQQLRIVKENARILRDGKEPNPNENGKHAMTATWTAMGLRGIEIMLKTTNRPAAACLANFAAVTAEETCLDLGEEAIKEYKNQ